MTDTRKVALNALIEYQRSDTFSNLTLKKHLRDIKDIRDRKFITALFYGVLERRLLLDYYIAAVSSVKIKKINIVVLNILRLGLYQIIFMSTPESEACNTSVQLAKNNGQYKSAGFVNAILRKLAKTYAQIKLPDDKLKRLSVEYSISESNLNKLVEAFGIDGFEKIMNEGYASDDGLYASVNYKKISTHDLIELLKKEGVNTSETEYPGLIRIENAVDIENSKAYLNGFFHLVGLPSYITASVVFSQKNSVVIDMCAAPGGKTFAISYNSDSDSKIYAFDIHEHKINNVIQNCKRLGVTNVFPRVSDGTVCFDEYKEIADTVLCDVPCSGLGMIFKKPDIKYKEIDFDNLIDTQYKILTNASRYLKSGGKLVYSTCTINPEENIGIINKFLFDNSEFCLDTDTEIYQGEYGQYQFYPNEKFSDGFYIAVLSKK